MGSSRRGLRPATAAALMGGVFVASIGVATAATVSLSSKSAVPAASAGESVDSDGSTQTDSTGSPKSPAGSVDPYGESEREITPVTNAPKKASKDAVKKSKATLCKADPGELPAINFQDENRKWGKVLETITANRGYAPGAIDGIYTVQTRNAVRQLQGEYGLAKDGEMSKSEWSALWDDLCAPEPVYVPPAEPVYTGPSDVGGGPTDSGGGGGGGLDRID